MVVIEVGASDRAAYPSLANRIRRLAAQVSAERVRFCLPVDDPFGEYLARFGCGWSVHFPENGGSMGRLVCVMSTMQRLLPTFTHRLAESGMSLPANGLSLDTDIGVTGLSVTGSRLSLSEDCLTGARIGISQMHLTQLLFGYRSVDDLMIGGEIRLSKNLIPVVSALFPKSNPDMWWGDRF